MNNLNKRIVFMGTPSFAANILEGLILNGYQIVLVVSQPDKEYGRKRELKASEVKQMALKYNIPVLTPRKIREEYDDVLKYNPDLIIVSAYGQILPKQLLDFPKYKCINTHGSLLPLYRGGAPIQRSIINGDSKTGISIMYMNEKMDEGDILFQKSIDIDISDTSTIMFEKLSNLALEMLIEFLPQFFNNDVNPICQDNSKVTYAKNLTKEDEHIDFNRNVLAVYNQIRGLLNTPGAYFIMNNKKYKIIKADFEYSEKAEAKTYQGLTDDYLRIDCLDGFIKVYTIKPEGKNEMSAKDFYNGSGRLLMGAEVE